MWIAMVVAAAASSAMAAHEANNASKSAIVRKEPSDWFRQEMLRMDRLRADEAAVRRGGLFGAVLIAALALSLIYAVYSLVAA